MPTLLEAIDGCGVTGQIITRPSDPRLDGGLRVALEQHSTTGWCTSRTIPYKACASDLLPSVKKTSMSTLSLSLYLGGGILFIMACMMFVWSKSWRARLYRTQWDYRFTGSVFLLFAVLAIAAGWYISWR